MDMGDGTDFPDRTWRRIRVEAMRRGLDPGMLAGLLLEQALDRSFGKSDLTDGTTNSIPEDSITPWNYREVAAVKIGRPLRSGEIAHHINGDRSDNRPENIAVLTKDEHSEAHRRGWGRGSGRKILP